MPINSRFEFKEYCLRRLGKGVIDINVSDEQVEDRIDDAIQYWQEFHGDAMVETFFKHQVTQADIDNEYITIPSNSQIQYITEILPLFEKNTSISMFDIRYQLRLNDIFDLNFAGSLSNYWQTQQYIGLLDRVLNNEERLRYSRRENKIFITMNWEESAKVGDYLIFKAYAFVDPAEATSAFNDLWLKAYSTALIKKQWGENLSKFEGVQLLGGVTMNGGQILDSALAEVDKLEEQIISRYQEPPDFLIG